MSGQAALRGPRSRPRTTVPATATAKRPRTKPARLERSASRRRSQRRRTNIKRSAAKPGRASTTERRELTRREGLITRLRQRLEARRQQLASRRATKVGAQPPSGWQRRAAIVVAKLAATFAVAWGLLVAGREVYEYATTSPRFEVQHFIYEPSAHVDDEALRELMAIAPGTNILACDLAGLSEAIVEHPWVASATVTRNMPDTLEVAIVEHEAAAIVLAGDFYLVNRAGEPFKAVERGERGELPIITGVGRDELAEASAASRPVAGLVDALALIDLYASKQRPRLGELHLEADGAVTLYTATSGTALQLGREDFGPRLERWDALRVALGDRADRLAVVHLDHESRPDRRDRVVARFTSERDEVVLLAQATSEQGAEAANEAEAEPKPARLPARAAGRRNRIPSYE